MTKTKIYLELPSGRQFVTEAETPTLAILQLWRPRIAPLVDLSDEALECVPWGQTSIRIAYPVHFGDASESEFISAVLAACHLTSAERRILAAAICAQYPAVERDVFRAAVGQALIENADLLGGPE